MLAELINPNLHVVLIHYPLAMLIAGVLIELFSFLWRRSSFRTAGRWMILIGALSAVPTTFSGIYALRDVSGVDVDTDMHWTDLKAASPVFSQPQVWEMLRNHVLYQSIGTALACLVVVVWMGASDRMRRIMYWPLLLILLWTVAIIVRAAWFGGEAVYRHGVAVSTTQQSDPATQPASWINTPTAVERMFPPLEMHPIMAGTFTAIALAAMGLSFRRANSIHALPVDHPIVTGDPATALQPASSRATSADVGRQFNPNIQVEVRPFAPAGRFWALAFLLAILTFAGGLFVIARGADLFTQMNGQPNQLPHLLWQQIYSSNGPKFTRHFTHFIAGIAIIVLPIILALLARFAPKERIILSLVTFLLAAAVAAQVWLGVLMLFDTPAGPVTRFNPPASAGAQP